MFETFSIINSLTVLNSVVDGLFEEAGVKTAGQRSEWIRRKLLVEYERVNRIKHINTRLERLAVLEVSDSQPRDLVVRLDKLDRREELERSEELEQVQVLDQIEEQQQRKVLEQIEEPEHIGQLKLLERLEQFIQLERLGQCGQLEEIKKFQEFMYSRYYKGHMVKVLRTCASLSKPFDRDKPLELDKLLDLDKLLERYRLRGLDVLLRLDDPFEREVRKLCEAYKLLLTRCEHLHQSWLKRFSQFKQLVHLFWYHLESNQKFKFLEALHFGTKTFTNAPLELQNLPDVKEKGLFTSILPCVSPDGKWVAIRLEDDKTTVQLYREQHQRQHHSYWRNPVYVIKEVKHFAFTNDSVFLLYLTVQRSLHTLSLASGTILTSVSSVRPLSSTPEKQSGYRFQDDDEETILCVKDFPPVFLSSFFPVVRVEPTKVGFASADAILVLYSDSTLALMKNDGTAIAWETSLTHPFGGSQQVKKGQFSPDGKVVVTYQGTNILLYHTVPGSTEASTEHGKCPNSVFGADDDFNVLYFTFSGNSTLLLFCIRRNLGLSFFVWNVQEKVLSASFDSLGLMCEDCCCCFSLDSRELIICFEFYIEFWDHTSHPCRLLRKLETDVPYTEMDKFTHCTVSPQNDLLAYCITDRILLCPLKTSRDQSILHLLRAHLGKVEFCQFLRGNRYLISYGVDGTVFLWDLSEWRVASFAKIVQGRESIVSMAVSPKGDRVVCVTSFGRLNSIKPCGLKGAMLSKLPLPKWMGSTEKMTEAFRGLVREPTTATQNLRCPNNTEDLDAAELRIAEMEFMLCSDDNDYSDEDSDEYWTEHQGSVLSCQDVPMLTSHVYIVCRELAISENEKSFEDSLIVTSLQ